MHQKAVPCLAQTKDYWQTFHLINKGNGNKANYIMAGKSRSHNWAPKFGLLPLQHGNEQHTVNKELMMRVGGISLLMGKAVRELAHSLCQQGAPVQNRAETHPAHLRGTDHIDGHMMGRKIWTDRKSEMISSPPKCTGAISQRRQMMKQQKRPVAHSPVHAGKDLREVLLGKMPRHQKK
jgi:hypothetical protein